MLFIIITLSLLSMLCVDSIEPETGPPSTRAVSTQSYNRGDVPLSYSITSYHDYTTIRPETRTPIYAVNNHVPQYTPFRPVYNDQLNHPPYQSPYKEQLQLNLLGQHQVRENTFQATEKNINKNYLEPRVVAKHGRIQNIQYNSFVPGHNVAVAPRYRHKSPVLSDLYINYQGPIQAQKIIVPKHVINEKQPMLVQTQVIKTNPESTHFVNTGFPVIPLKNFSENTYVSQNTHEHKEVLFPQLPAPRAPRLHLNIARVYGIAHISRQAPEPAVTRENPPSHTQAFIVPKQNIQEKTLLPIQNFKRYLIKNHQKN